MEPPSQHRIPARSRREAMDWGLVLLSQGISATPERDPDAGWNLLVEPGDVVAAERALQLYRSENRRWRWRQPLPWPGLAFDWTSLLWVVLLAVFYWLAALSGTFWKTAGVMDNQAVRAGEWWRIFTAMQLHADLGHLSANLAIGFVLLGLVMGRFGPGIGSLAAFLAGAAGNVAGLFFYPDPHASLGASGMVMGALGLLAAQSVALLRRRVIPSRQIFAALAAGVMLLALFGFSPHSDMVAHVGGFGAGVILGALLGLLPARWQNPRTNLAAGIVVGAIIIFSWGVALHLGSQNSI